MPNELMSPPRPQWLAEIEAPRFDLAERKLEEKVAAEREAQARERAIERAARERALFQLD